MPGSIVNWPGSSAAETSILRAEAAPEPFTGPDSPARRRKVSVLPSEQFPIRLTNEQLQLARQTGFIVQKSLETGSETGRLRIDVQDMTTGAAGSIWVPVEY